MLDRKIVITGGAGLVGQNLVQRLANSGCRNIVTIDKNEHNSAILRRMQPSVNMVVADLADTGTWEDQLANCAALVIAHAQIGGLDPKEFERNNVRATELVLGAAKGHSVPYLVHLSSSVVNSAAVDNYTETKKRQEALVVAAGIKHIVLRPTLMFGWFDRKHMGWLARFMGRAPFFPVPGSGRFVRQPLYVGDFCAIIIAAIEAELTGSYNITGQEEIAYIDLMRAVRRCVNGKARLIRIPYPAFWLLLKAYGTFNANPPFTTKQLRALVTPDLFEVIDWPSIFGVHATRLEQALSETFTDPTYSHVTLEF